MSYSEDKLSLSALLGGKSKLVLAVLVDLHTEKCISNVAHLNNAQIVKLAIKVCVYVTSIGLESTK